MTSPYVTVALIAAAVILNIAIRRNLKHRASARLYRDRYVTIAEDLVSKSELPDAHAKQLVMMASLPLGLFTFVVVALTFWRAITSKQPVMRRTEVDVERMPEHLRERYVSAILAFVIADSYFTLFSGSIYRAMNSWIFDAENEVKPDVNAHATRQIVTSVDQVRRNKPFGLFSKAVCA